MYTEHLIFFSMKAILLKMDTTNLIETREFNFNRNLPTQVFKDPIIMPHLLNLL